MLYSVSTLGRIVSHTKDLESKNRIIHISAKLLTPSKTKHGYMYITLVKNKVRTKRYVHRLVGLVFLQNPNNYLEIDHIDGDPSNNNYINLRWCSRQQNQLNPITRYRSSKALLGRTNTSNSKTVVQLYKGEIIKTYPSMADAQRSGFCQSEVSRCCHGLITHHKGFQ